MMKKNSEEETLLIEELNSAAPYQKNISKTGVFLLTLSGGAAVAISAICLPFVTPALRRVCLPFVPATNKQISNVIEALKAPPSITTAKTSIEWKCRQSGRLLVDLGSGDGRVVEATCKEGISSVGVELNAWLVIYSNMRALWTGITPKPRYLRADLWNFKLGNFSDVVIFGVQSMMPELESKMGLELDEGCRVVACRFPLPSWKPIATFGSGVDTVWLYRVGRVK